MFACCRHGIVDVEILVALDVVVGHVQFPLDELMPYESFRQGDRRVKTLVMLGDGMQGYVGGSEPLKMF